MSEELKPCPFCHAQPTILTEENTACWYVECLCEAQGPHESTGEQAIAAWNSRYYDEADRQATRAALVSEIVAWLREGSTRACAFADEIEAKWGGK